MRWSKLRISNCFSPLYWFIRWVLEFYSLTDRIESSVFIFDQWTDNLVLCDNAFSFIVLFFLGLDRRQPPWLFRSVIKLGWIWWEVVHHVIGIVLLNRFRSVVDKNRDWIVVRKSVCWMIFVSLNRNVCILAEIITCNGNVVQVSLSSQVRCMILFEFCSFYVLVNNTRLVLGILLGIGKDTSLIIVKYVHFINRLAHHQFSC